MVGRGFGGWCARGCCFGLVLSFASESLAQSTASFPAPPGASTAPAVTPAPPPTPAPPARPAPSAAPSATPSPKSAPSPAPAPPPANPAPPVAIADGSANRSAAEGGALQPTPAVANGFYPALLPYRAGMPIPPGYRVEHRAAVGIIAGGLATFGIAYGTALVIGAKASFGDGTGWVAIPVIGPWAAIGARSYHCSNDPLQANQCVSGAFSEVQTIAALSADGVIQAAGAVLFVVGLASGHDELVRTDLPVSLRVSPRQVGADGFGFGVDGHF
jgi:hypothetical protein